MLYHAACCDAFTALSTCLRVSDSCLHVLELEVDFLDSQALSAAQAWLFPCHCHCFIGPSHVWPQDQIWLCTVMLGGTRDSVLETPYSMAEEKLQSWKKATGLITWCWPAWREPLKASQLRLHPCPQGRDVPAWILGWGQFHRAAAAGGHRLGRTTHPLPPPRPCQCHSRHRLLVTPQARRAWKADTLSSLLMKPSSYGHTWPV